MFHQPAQQGLLTVEGEDFTELAQEHRLALDVGAQGVDGTTVDADLDRVDAGQAPRGGVIRINLFGLLLGDLLLRLAGCLTGGLSLADTGGGIVDEDLVHLLDGDALIECIHHS